MNPTQERLLVLLKEFIRVCNKHNLRYFVDGGTLLGAMRHKGFIPWDDDIDVSMPREDYDKYVKLQYEYDGTPYFIQTWRTDPHYTYCFAKLRDSSTTFIENFYVNHRINHGVWIDIFPLDGMSYKDKPREKCAPRIRFVWWMNYMSYLPQLTRKFHKETFFKDLGLNIIGCLFYIMDPFHIRNRIVEHHLRHYKLDKAVLAGNYYDFKPKQQAMPISLFKEFIEVPFEDIMVTAPKEYDKYLTMSYGDWRTPPPKEKQIGMHFDKGFSLTQGYKEYMKEHRI
ncbi:MAG: LicD family protein [Erysipelotrichaceae bacterium]|nr:LicD family protein [Erysipelotrichaceae bacterium]